MTNQPLRLALLALCGTTLLACRAAPRAAASDLSRTVTQTAGDAPAAPPDEPSTPDEPTPVVQAAYCADPETQRFHRGDCPHLRACALPFTDVADALSQGHLPAEDCRPPMQPPAARPDVPDDCQVDADCSSSPSGGCGCGRCGYRWPRPMSRTHHDWLAGQYAMESRPRLVCQPCEVPGGRLEVRAICVEGACTLTYW